MNKVYLFIIRVILGGVIAVIITKIFKPDTGPGFIIGFAAGLVCAAYGLEYLRKRRSKT